MANLDDTFDVEITKYFEERNAEELRRRNENPWTNVEAGMSPEANNQVDAQVLPDVGFKQGEEVWVPRELEGVIDIDTFDDDSQSVELSNSVWKNEETTREVSEVLGNLNENDDEVEILTLTGVTPHLCRHRRVPHAEVERSTVGNFTVLESRVLEDGRKLERVQEHAEELPELPATDELVNDLGDVDSEGRVLVPLDKDGNVPQEYKHLLEPVIHEMKYEDIIRLNNNEKAPIAPYALEDGNDDIIDQGAEYDEPAAEPAASLPKANDYHDSQEVDSDLARAEYDEAEPETVETVAEQLEPIIPSEELKKLEEQIRIKADLEKEDLKEVNKESEEIGETEDKVIEKEEEMKDIEDDLRRIEETADTERKGEPLTNGEDDKESGKKQLQMEEQKGPETKESKENSRDTLIEAVQLEVPTKVEESDTNKVPENERKQQIPVIAEATNAVESHLPSEDVTDDQDIDAELMEIVSGAFFDHHINYGPVNILKKG